MKHGSRSFSLVFTALGSLVVIFLALPLGAILFNAGFQGLWGALNTPEVLRSLVLTLTAAGLATGIALLGGTPLAYLLARRRFRGKRVLEAVVDLPVVTPHTAAGIALLLVFGSKGLLGEPLSRLGLIFTDRLAGIVIAMLFVSLPYLVNMSREAFALVDSELEATALVEGATPWQAFLQISLPLAWRGVVGGAMMMWARGISEFGAVVIIAYHPKVATVLIYELFQGFGLNAALPVAALLILVVMVVFAALRFVVLGEE